MPLSPGIEANRPAILSLRDCVGEASLAGFGALTLWAGRDWFPVSGAGSLAGDTEGLMAFDLLGGVEGALGSAPAKCMWAKG